MRGGRQVSVANVPVVGNVTPVAAVIVNVVANAPEVVRFPPSVIVPVLLTPVPPRAAVSVPAAMAAASSVPPPAALWWVCVALANEAIVGVTMVGLVPNTRAPDPVSSVIALARFALEGVASQVATPVPKPVSPPTGSVQFVKVPLWGVPRIGVTKVGQVCSLWPSFNRAAARLALEGVWSHVDTPEPRPETPVLMGSPVQLESVPEVGVPNRGAMRVGVFAKTRAPVPVSSLMTPANAELLVEAN